MDEFKHRECFPGRSRVYWNIHGAATSATATWVAVQVGPSCYYRVMEFAWPAEKYKVENLERMLDAMLETGKGLAKKEIRDALGIEK